MDEIIGKPLHASSSIHILSYHDGRVYGDMDLNVWCPTLSGLDLLN